MKTTIAAVNKELKARGIAERLRRGKGYYYFAEGDAHKWYSSSAYTNSVTGFTVEGWIKELEFLRSDWRNR
jgi:hypothetical protein